MQRVGVWQVTGDGPQRLESTSVELERNLEDWIVNDPGMLQSGLTVVGRQISTEGGPLDVLALDPQGRWIVIEIKRGTLRRETVAQAIDYASCLAMMPYADLYGKLLTWWKDCGHAAEQLDKVLHDCGAREEPDSVDRDVNMLLVGTGMTSGLDRMVSFLSQKHEIPIDLVTYQAFDLPNGNKVMVRELSDVDIVDRRRDSTFLTVEQICDMADERNVGKQMRLLVKAAKQHGIHTRSYKRCIMFTPPQRKNRCLFAAWVDHVKYGPMTIYAYTSAFSEFYEITGKDATAALGEDRYFDGKDERALESFILGLDKLVGKAGDEDDRQNTD